MLRKFRLQKFMIEYDVKFILSHIVYNMIIFMKALIALKIFNRHTAIY